MARIGSFFIWPGGKYADMVFSTVIAGFFTGGALAVRGGLKAARNSAIACGCLLAVIEGVGIGFQRMMAEGTKLEVGFPSSTPSTPTR